MNDQVTRYLEEFIRFLEKYDTEGAVWYAVSLLESGAVPVPVLYEQVVAPSLNRILVGRAEEHDMIWREHVMSNLIRSVIESARPYVIRERDKAGFPGERPAAMLACPEEEYHELGIRMGADFFTIAGYNVTYIGCNTPRSNILSAARALKSDVICIASTNYLNLPAVSKIVTELRRETGRKAKILLSGSALRNSNVTAKKLGADGEVNSFADIVSLKEGSRENSL